MTRSIAFALFLATAVAALAQPPWHTAFPPMNKMRSMAGTWQGRVLDSPFRRNLPVRLVYEAVSGGQAVLERLKMGDSDEMVSVYHQEGDQLMMTHYCSSNTQPRLRTRRYPADLSSFELEFVDSTNILKANWMNIVSLKLEFFKPDWLRQTWKSHDPHERPVLLEVQRVR